MSAIWGYVNYTSSDDINNICNIVEQKYQLYKVDRIDHVISDGVVFGCCHQYFTSTACDEILPYLDVENGILFTADCVLDNRDLLLNEFKFLPHDTPDGKILYHAYLKWGASFTKYVTGAFSFAAYHINEKKTILVTDHMTNRSLFYYYHDKKLYFSTAIIPLISSMDIKLSEKWVSGCLSNTSADMMIFRQITPYEGIYQMDAAQIITFYTEKKEIQQYWNPCKIRTSYKRLTFEQYKALFIDTLNNAIVSMLRSPQETGCTLSSGLDSSTIACLAAPMLNKSKKKLYSFTSVPLKEFHSDRDSYSVVDETDGVRLIVSKYPYIQPTFVECPKGDAFSALPALIPFIGYPMKSGQNLTWLNEIYSIAAQKKCKLILKGQFGNSTISYGTALGTIYRQVRSFHFIGAYRSAIQFSKVNRIPKKQILQRFLYETVDKFKTPKFDTSQVLTSSELMRKYRVLRKISKIQSKGGGGVMDSRIQRLRFLHDPYALTQLGMFDTIMGLIHGVLIRDPAKDKNVVELCCRLPVSCELSGGFERGMIRSYMEGIVPEAILKDTEHRGLQSADYMYRCRKNWLHIYPSVISTLVKSDIHKYLDKSRYQSLLDKLMLKDALVLSDEDIRQTNVLYSFALLMEVIKEEH